MARRAHVGVKCDNGGSEHCGCHCPTVRRSKAKAKLLRNSNLPGNQAAHIFLPAPSPCAMHARAFAKCAKWRRENGMRPGGGKCGRRVAPMPASSKPCPSNSCRTSRQPGSASFAVDKRMPCPHRLLRARKSPPQPMAGHERPARLLALPSTARDMKEAGRP